MAQATWPPEPNPFLLAIPPAYVFVVGDDDDPVVPEGGRGLNLGYLLSQEVIELGAAIVDRFAVRLPVLAAVRNDHVQMGHLAGREASAERGHPVGSGAGRDVVGDAFSGLSGR
jgi:hypothetical protein